MSPLGWGSESEGAVFARARDRSGTSAGLNWRVLPLKVSPRRWSLACFSDSFWVDPKPKRAGNRQESTVEPLRTMKAQWLER